MQGYSVSLDILSIGKRVIYSADEVRIMKLNLCRKKQMGRYVFPTLLYALSAFNGVLLAAIPTSSASAQTSFIVTGNSNSGEASYNFSLNVGGAVCGFAVRSGWETSGGAWNVLSRTSLINNAASPTCQQFIYYSLSMGYSPTDIDNGRPPTYISPVSTGNFSTFRRAESGLPGIPQANVGLFATYGGVQIDQQYSGDYVVVVTTDRGARVTSAQVQLCNPICRTLSEAAVPPAP
jgi:hypothetical protein